MNNKKIITDYPLLLAILILSAVGIVMVYSASSVHALSKYNNSNLFLTKHAVRVLIGLVLMGITSLIDYHIYRKFSKSVLILAGLLLMYVLFVDSISIKGSTRWMDIAGMSFQPSELAKYALIIYFADCLVRKQDKLHSLVDGYLPILMVLAVFALLILLENDFSGAFVIGFIIFLMFFTANVRILHLAGTVTAAIPFVVIAIYMAPYRLARIKALINPDLDPLGSGYQVRQSLISLGSGGLFGAGVGMSHEKMLYLPEPFTDYIFAILGEELGFIGAFFVLTLFLIILWRGFIIAKKAPDLYGTLLASGITLSIVVTAFINVGVVCGLLPPTGLTMPFISYGGTSLIFSFAAVGILLNVARTQSEGSGSKKRKKREHKQKKRIINAVR